MKLEPSVTRPYSRLAYIVAAVLGLVVGTTSMLVWSHSQTMEPLSVTKVDALDATGAVRLRGTLQVDGASTLGGAARITSRQGIGIDTTSGALTTPKVISFPGDPNGVVANTSPIGTLALDVTTPALWLNTDGVTAFTRVGGGVSSQRITANGVYVPTPGTTAVLLEEVAGGGGGGGATNGGAGARSAAAGGSSGNYLRKWIQPGALITGGAVVIGAGGAGGVVGGNGDVGADGSVIIQGVTYTVKGGVGGTGAVPSAAGDGSYATPCVGGSTVADLNYCGGGGYSIQSANQEFAGLGGGTPLGAGGQPGVGQAPGGNGQGFGAGGAGGQCSGGANPPQAGGNGAPGVVVVTEFH